jgi:hypothetical protein
MILNRARANAMMEPMTKTQHTKRREQSATVKVSLFDHLLHQSIFASPLLPNSLVSCHFSLLECLSLNEDIGLKERFASSNVLCLFSIDLLRYRHS